ncbi:MAG: M1 family metallopeptidase [Bradymonadia bacterium]
MFARVMVFSLLMVPSLVAAQSGAEKFKQLEEILPTPTEVRLASGAPGPKYWQQKVDYVIEAVLDDSKQRITGRETITYTNRSPHTLDYLWMQLDQNRFKKDSETLAISSAPGFKEFPYRNLQRLLALETFEGGYEIKSVETTSGKAIPHTVSGTMMRLDPAKPVKPGERIRFVVEWSYNIIDAEVMWGRGGYEHFKKEDNYIYTIAQWYPRMAAYDDVDGWQNKQFLGRGEFTLELGDYDVRLTVPKDHIVGATGVLKNPGAVLTRTQRDRLKKARTSKEPIFIVTPDEAKKAQEGKAAGYKTWRFTAKNIRDFAFGSSRKFIWDAWGHKQDRDTVMCMSFYPNEAEPLWSTYSTQAIAHTIEVYGRMTFDYPYPTAISMNGPVGGMEYPMISFNGPRTDEDGTYYDKYAKGRDWRRTKYGLISVIIHEVGHNWFPMIVNSDERQWTWMDEGLNTFLQFIAEQEWEPDYPSWRGEPQAIVGYMKSTQQVPIMTNSESILQFGNNAYAKPATALNVLRDTVMGRELFDYAFKKYANRWRFKRPMPADFFRTMEDASAVDLDWFWRGWFYTTDHVDVALAGVQEYMLDTGDPDVEKPRKKKEKDEAPTTRFEHLNSEFKDFRVNRFPKLKDFYNSYDPLDVTEEDREGFKKMLEGLEPHEKELLATKRHFYVLDFENVGGLVSPVIVELEFEGGETQEIRIPAQIWQKDAEKVSKLFMTKKPVVRVQLDPHLETADTDTSNNSWPVKPKESRFKLFKRKFEKNAMQKAADAKKKAEEKAKKEAEEKAEGDKKGANKKDADKKADDKKSSEKGSEK